MVTFADVLWYIKHIYIYMIHITITHEMQFERTRHTYFERKIHDTMLKCAIMV